MKKGSIDVINLKKFVGANSEFGPNYQFERPFEFNALVNHYMQYYYDSEQEPEKYMLKLGHAVRWANKSIMLEKLGIESYQDPEDSDPAMFKSVMTEIAKSNEHFVVENEHIKFEPSFSKSMDGNKSELNKSCEALWKKAFDTVIERNRT